MSNDVPKAGVNLRNRVGKVVSGKMSWRYNRTNLSHSYQRCSMILIDPDVEKMRYRPYTCCCAEMVDLGMAVRVEFCGTEADENDVNASFYYFFAEEEILHAK